VRRQTQTAEELGLNVSTASDGKDLSLCGVAKFEIEMLYTVHARVQYVEILPVVRRLAVNSFSLCQTKQAAEQKRGTPQQQRTLLLQ
jgi:hypothetical protein